MCKEEVSLLSPCVTSADVTLKLFNAWIIYARNIMNSKTQTLSDFFFWGEQLLNRLWLIKVTSEK